MKPVAWIGVGMGLCWCAFLAGLGMFSDGELDPDWQTAFIFVLVASLPAVIVMVLRTRAALIIAALLTLPISLMSLAGATLPLLIPAILYVAAAVRFERST